MSVLRAAIVTMVAQGLTGLPAAAQTGAASNIAPSDTRSIIAPRLPVPDDGRDAAPRKFLEDARAALHQGHTGAAQEALERAETRLLDRGDPTNAEAPAHARLLQVTTEARAALGAHNVTRATAILDRGLAAPMAVAALPPPPPQLAYPPATPGWRWDGTQWVPGAAASGIWVPGQWIWRGAWVWEPGHWR